jgi:anti-sigma-K factor RskA
MNHDLRFEQAADVYALGALDGQELTEFEAHLASGCPACAERLRETRDALMLLPRSLPQEAPPPALRARLLERIAAERPVARAPVALRPERRRSRGLWWAGWAGLAAAAVLLVLVHAQLRATREEIRNLETRLSTLQTELAEREETLRFLSDPDVRYVSLAGLKPTPEASAWLLWNPAARKGLLLARGLPPAPPGRAYELWAIAGTEPVPAGVFTVDAAGRGLLRLPPLPGGQTFDTFAVTLEPAGGVPKPTGPMHLAGKVL